MAGQMIDGGFWKDRPVLVTGAAGFLGSWLSAELAGRGAKVLALDLKPGFPRLGEPLDAVLGRPAYVQGDVRDGALLRTLFAEHGFQTVFHLAAKAIVGEALENPAETLDTNIRGTWQVLEAFRRHGQDGQVVIASSDKAYGSHETLPYREEHELKGLDHPYDCSKACADRIGQMYGRAYGVPVCVTRSGNIFGGGDTNFSRLIPDTIRSLAQNRSVVLRSDGSYVRDYIYVTDVVAGCLRTAEAMAEQGLSGEAFNFGNRRPLTALEVVATIGRLMGKEHLRPVIDRTDKFEIKSQYLDPSKAMAVLGWQPRHTLESGLGETIGWYQRFFEAHAGGEA